jgi:leader peptidase (prepilin peptidase) / N-methyltransferase
MPTARGHRWAVGAVGAFIAVALLGRYGFTGEGFLFAFVGMVLVLVSAIDLERRIIPNRIVLPAIAIVLTAQIALSPDRTLEWVLAALGCGLFFLLPLIMYPSGLGLGDVKLAVLIGAALGLAAMGALLIGLFAGAAFAASILLRQGTSARKATIAFGPFLAFGALFSLLFV